MLADMDEHVLYINPPARPLIIDADPERFEQVITHLLDNARKYSDPGDSIRIAGRREDRTATLIVQDTGRDQGTTVTISLPLAAE